MTATAQAASAVRCPHCGAGPETAKIERLLGQLVEFRYTCGKCGRAWARFEGAE